MKSATADKENYCVYTVDSFFYESYCCYPSVGIDSKNALTTYRVNSPGLRNSAGPEVDSQLAQL